MKKEAEDAQQRMLDNYESQKLAVKESESAKQRTEFSRYKQDCRKRALDLAQTQIQSTPFEELFDKESFIKEGKIYHQSIAREEVFISLADKYYNWLISIPE